MRREVQAMLVAAAGGAVVTVVLRHAHVGVPYWYLVTLFPLAVAFFLVVRGTLPGMRPTPGRHPSPVPTHGAAPDPRVPLDVLVPLEQRINAALSDRRRFAGDLRPVLAEVATSPWNEEVDRWLNPSRTPQPLTTERLARLLDAIERQQP